MVALISDRVSDLGLDDRKFAGQTMPASISNRASRSQSGLDLDLGATPAGAGAHASRRPGRAKTAARGKARQRRP
jgi:hypothetical protein